MKRPLNGVIEDVIIQPSKIQPIIVNFQNGELKDDEANKMSCGVFYDKNKHNTLLALSNGQIVYKGYKPDLSKELTRTMLVFHNKRTGKVRLVQAERWQVSPVLQKLEDYDNGEEKRNDKLAQLNKQFGSKRVKRRTEQYERMKVNIESVKEQLEQTVSNVEVDRSDLTTQQSGEYITNTNLPTINRDATKLKDVYNMYEIVPKSKLKTLYETATEALKGNVTGNSQFFRDTMEHLKSDSDSKKKVAMLLYIEAVTKWLNMPLKDAKKRNIELCAYSSEINSHVIETYSILSISGRSRPASMKDKAVIHCMILALIISNYVLDMELFFTTLTAKIGLRKLAEFARIIAATPSKENKKIISLKLPLPPQAAIVKSTKKTKKAK